MVFLGCTAVHEGIGDYPDDTNDADDSSDDDVAEDVGSDSGDDGSTGGSGGGEGTNDDESSGGGPTDDLGSDDSGGEDTGTGSGDSDADESDSSDAGTDGGSSDGDSGTDGGDSTEDDSGDDSADDGSEDDDSEDDGSDDGGGECPANTHRCVDPAPGGWFGPIAFYQGGAGDVAPACVGGYTEAAFSSFAGLNPGDASCACRCGDAEVECVFASANFRAVNSSCDGGSPSPVHTINTLGCYSLDETYDTGRWRTRNGSNTLADGGSCPSRIEESIAEPSWSAKMKGCGGAQLIDACAGDQVCAPVPVVPFEPRHCIYRAGEAECPDGSYSEHFEGFEGYEDSRACAGSCGCTEPEGECRTSIELFSGGCDNTPDAEIPVPGDCLVGEGSISSGRLKFTAEATCEPTGEAEITGEVEPDGVITVCCTP